MTAKTVNYTEAQTTEIVNSYKAGETVEQIAERVGKSARSVVAKLTREGVYQAKTKVAGARAQTKLSMLALVEDLLELERCALESLAKGDKATIEALMAAVANKVN